MLGAGGLRCEPAGLSPVLRTAQNRGRRNALEWCSCNAAVVTRALLLCWVQVSRTKSPCVAAYTDAWRHTNPHAPVPLHKSRAMPTLLPLAVAPRKSQEPVAGPVLCTRLSPLPRSAWRVLAAPKPQEPAACRLFRTRCRPLPRFWGGFSGSCLILFKLKNISF